MAVTICTARAIKTVAVSMRPIEGTNRRNGLITGDVLLRYNDEPLTDLQTYSNLLRQSAPGDQVQIQVLREQQTFTIEATLKAR